TFPFVGTILDKLPYRATAKWMTTADWPRLSAHHKSRITSKINSHQYLFIYRILSGYILRSLNIVTDVAAQKRTHAARSAALDCWLNAALSYSSNEGYAQGKFPLGSTYGRSGDHQSKGLRNRGRNDGRQSL